MSHHSFLNVLNADTYTCDFEDYLCDFWSQDSHDSFNWWINQGTTPTYTTGPTSGHGSGEYASIENVYQAWSVHINNVNE